MTQEDKELLLKDLSARLFYNPWVQFNLEYGDNGHKEGLYMAHISSIDPTSGWLEVDYFETETLEKEWSSTIENVKPYLRPMSSMTEEEKNELKTIGCKFFNNHIHFLIIDEWGNEEIYNEGDYYIVIDWLNAHHFDFRLTSEGLSMIEAGLALEASDGIYK